MLARRSALQRIPWTLSFVGLLAYTLAIVTYALPIGEASMMAALLGVLFTRGGIRVPAFLLLFGALILWSIVGYASTAYPESVYQAVDTAARIWLVAFVAVNAIRTPSHLRFYLVFFLACYAMYPARGAIFNYLAGYTIFGRTLWNYIYENPNDLAALTFLPLSIAAALFMTERNRLFRLGALASLVVFPILILMTQSRGAVIALAIVGLLVLTWQRNRGRILAGMVALALVAAMVVPESAWDRFSGLTNLTSTETIGAADEEGSAAARFNIWKTAVLVIKDHPLTGVGLGAYPEAHYRYAPLVDLGTDAWGGTRGSPEGMKDAHSTYLSLLATTGIPGLLLFVSMLAAVFTRAERVRKRIRTRAPAYASLILYLELGLVAFLVAGIFGSFALLSFPYIQLALIWTAAEIGEKEQRRVAKSRQVPQSRSAAPRPAVVQ